MQAISVGSYSRSTDINGDELEATLAFRLGVVMVTLMSAVTGSVSMVLPLLVSSRWASCAAGSHAGSHPGERPSNTSDSREQRAAARPRSGTDSNGSGCLHRYLRIGRLGGAGAKCPSLATWQARQFHSSTDRSSKCWSRSLNVARCLRHSTMSRAGSLGVHGGLYAQIHRHAGGFGARRC